MIEHNFKVGDTIAVWLPESAEKVYFFANPNLKFFLVNKTACNIGFRRKNGFKGFRHRQLPKLCCRRSHMVKTI
jgi:hypothetical protein